MRILDDQTIVALSTPPGSGGLAVVRLSGPVALSTVRRFFSRPQALKPRYSTFGYLRHSELGPGIFDSCLVTYFKAPNSVTGEDVVEISIHGGAYLQRKLLEVLSRQPEVRLAEPGEFTLRGFLNGKFDLTQAESIADLIAAETAASHQAATRQLQGHLKQVFSSWQSRLRNMLALLEAELDFTEHEIDATPVESFVPQLKQVTREIREILNTAYYGRKLEEGFYALLYGATNVGKSSIFNRLAGEERALVTPHPGTTRDLLEVVLVIAGHKVILVDTAGESDRPEAIEKLGIERAQKMRTKADFVIHVQSPDVPPIPEPSLLPHQRLIKVMNKADLIDGELALNGLIPLSCKTGDGFDALHKALEEAVEGARQTTREGLVLTVARQEQTLERLAASLQEAERACEEKRPSELVASDLRQCLAVLGELTGETTPDDVLREIFSRFCIGK